MSLAPIVLFVYNRPWHTKQTIEALQKNELAKDSELFIYSDEAKNEDAKENVNEVRDYIKSINGFKNIKVIERNVNFGLARSIIDGVTNIVNDYGNIIVLEDDLVTSSYFLKYMNDALNLYKNDKRIMSITGFNLPKEKFLIPKEYPYDIYLNKRCMSQGWGTWKAQWEKVDWDVKDYESLKNTPKKIKAFNEGGLDLFDMLQKQMNGEINSWAIRFCYAHSKSQMFTLYPVESLIYNTGFDGSGTHCKAEKEVNKDIKLPTKEVELIADIQPNKSLIKRHEKVYARSFFTKIKSRVKKILNLMKIES